MKGYMIFVEGMAHPQVVHDDYVTAKWQTKQLAQKNPGKEVMLMQLHKRMRIDADGTYTKLPTHIPTNHLAKKHPRPLLRLQGLAHKQEA